MPLGIPIDDRIPHGAGDPAVGDIQVVCDDMVEAEGCRNRLGEHREAAGDQGGMHPGGTRCREQRPRAGHDPNALGRIVEHRNRQTPQQRHPFAEGGGEIELAVHRPPRDLGDLGAQTDEIGQLVEHLILDDRRFEIGDEQPLAAPLEGLHDNVDRGLADRFARGAFGHGGRRCPSTGRSHAAPGASQSGSPLISKRAGDRGGDVSGSASLAPGPPINVMIQGHAAPPPLWLVCSSQNAALHRMMARD